MNRDLTVPNPVWGDRSVGVVLGSAAGDALGAGYEFGPALPADQAIHMDGGGCDDDDFDAVVCAFVARAALCGTTTLPEPTDLGTAQREGWIHVPTASVEEIVG